MASGRVSVAEGAGLMKNPGRNSKKTPGGQPAVAVLCVKQMEVCHWSETLDCEMHKGIITGQKARADS